MWKPFITIAFIVWRLSSPLNLSAQVQQTLPNEPQRAEAAVTAPAYNPPQIVVAASIDGNENLLLVSYRTIYIGFQGESYNSRTVTKTALKDVSILNVKGERVSINAARERIGGRDTPVLCSSWKTPLPEFYASMFAPPTLHFIFPKQSPVWKEIQEPGRPIER